MQNSPVSKIVKEPLLTERKRRRKTGEVPYPVQYSSALANMDIWGHMFLIRCCQGLTMHQFSKPPLTVLDLGCGSGYWAIEAAKQWKESTIVGFDLKKMHPAASVLRLRNIRWVYGDLLEKLPFESNSFDFVRIVGIGLGIPEDEWPFVLEEVARVMGPGAILEIIEEDLIFPYGPVPDAATEPAHEPTSPLTVLSDGWCSRLFSDKTSQETLPLSPTPSSYHLSWPTMTDTLKTFQSGETTISLSTRNDHPKDHTMLKKAWDAMLSTRFLATQLTSVLPFYLGSTFVDVKTHRPLRIPLPPSPHQKTSQVVACSGQTCRDAFDPDTLFRLKSSSRKLSIETKCDCSLWSVKGPKRKVPLCSSMHLAKTVQTVLACKEAIWTEYDKLCRNTLHPVMRPCRTGDNEEQEKLSLRGEFELAWSSWANDMTDRIGIRKQIAAGCPWYEPSDEPPDRKVRKSKLDEPSPESHTARPSSPDVQDLCRSLRCFVCCKPS